MGTYTSQTKQKVRIVVIVTAFTVVIFVSKERSLLSSSLLTTRGQLMPGAGLNPNFFSSDAGGVFSF